MTKNKNKGVDKMKNKKNKSWFKKNPIWTVIICISVFFFLISLLGSGSENIPKDTEIIDTTVESVKTESIESIEKEKIEIIDADASDGKVYLWLINKDLNNEKCYPFLDDDKECQTFKIKIQNNSRDDILASNFMAWDAWIGDYGISANNTSGPDKIRKDGTGEVEVYYEVEIGKIIDEVVFEYGFSNEIILKIK
jgi:hypothetical protein